MPGNPAVRDLASSMTEAATASLGSDWPKVRDFAKPELARLARSLLDIGRLAAEQKISLEEAHSLVEIHKNTTRMVMLTVQGLGILAVERAINAALGAVRDTINTALGVALL